MPRTNGHVNLGPTSAAPPRVEGSFDSAQDRRGSRVANGRTNGAANGSFNKLTTGHARAASQRARPSRADLERRLADLQAENDALREQVRALERERDGTLRGIEVLTHGLRRRGCCDHDAGNGAL
jgi:hypothetical protein